MHRRGLTMRQALVLFFTLTVIFTVGGTTLAVNLPKKISAMHEVKASVAELENTKEQQVKKLEQVKSEMEQVNTEIQSARETLEQMKEQGLDISEPSGENEEEPAKYAYLTFDDGPSENTIKILDFLKANNIKATFFVIGTQGYDDVYKRIVDEGHTLAIHSNTHEYSDIYVNEETFMNDIATLSNRLEKLTGVKPTIMRFPGGSNNTISHRYGGADLMDKLVKKVSDAGYLYYDWNVDSSDATAVCKDKNAIVNSVMNGVEGQDHAVILMHDASAKTSTVAALPEIVDGLRKKGFILEPITEETPLVQFNKVK